MERYHGIDVNDKRVLRICRKLNIKSTIKYSNNGCTRQAASPQYIAENILNREFTAKAPNEKWNGKGYPDGLKGTEIPLCARIMSVADVFDAISTNRCYRQAIPLKKCYDVIRRGSGVDFDPDVVEAFLMDTNQVERIYEMMNDSPLTEVTKGSNE